MTYGCESWTLTKSDRRRIEAFELWCWKRLLRIPWTAKVSNVKVIERIRPEFSLVGKVTKQKLSYLGHVIMANSLEKEIMLGMVGGKREPGRPRTQWLDTIKTDTEMNINKLKEAVIDRKA